MRPVAPPPSARLLLPRRELGSASRRTPPGRLGFALRALYLVGASAVLLCAGCGSSGQAYIPVDSPLRPWQAPEASPEAAAAPGAPTAKPAPAPDPSTTPAPAPAPAAETAKKKTGKK